MGLGEKLMKIVVKVRSVVELARRFEESPALAMREVVAEVQRGFRATLERVMDAEIALFLGGPEGQGNKRNGYTTRTFAVKGIGSVEVRVPRDRKGVFTSNVVPARRHYDEAIEKDMAMLNLAGLSTRMLSYLSRGLLGIKVSPQEVSNAMHAIVPAAKAFMERPLNGRRFKYLYIDGTNFRVRRTTVEKEPTLVVVGVDENDRKSVLAMVGGDKENKGSWAMVFSELKERGLDGSAVQLGIMDGLPGLEDAFTDAFPRARVGRCWVHKAGNVFPRVPKRYQAAFKSDWDKVQYAEGRASALAAYKALEDRWGRVCADGVACMAKDLEALLVHYEFPQEHWDALRTTNPIERVNKEFKRRSKAMEVVSPDGLKCLLAFTAMRLEYGWQTTPLTSGKLKNLPGRGRPRAKSKLEVVEEKLLN
jgi:transposase-like protein